MAITKRLPSKQDTGKPVDLNARGLTGGGITGPRIIKDRTAMVPNFDPGIKGKQQKARKPWYR